MQVTPQPFHHTPYLNAGRNGGTVRERLPWLRGSVAGLPDGLDALLVMAGKGADAPTERPAAGSGAQREPGL